MVGEGLVWLPSLCPGQELDLTVDNGSALETPFKVGDEERNRS